MHNKHQFRADLCRSWWRWAYMTPFFGHLFIFDSRYISLCVSFYVKRQNVNIALNDLSSKTPPTYTLLCVCRKCLIHLSCMSEGLSAQRLLFMFFLFIYEKSAYYLAHSQFNFDFILKIFPNGVHFFLLCNFLIYKRELNSDISLIALDSAVYAQTNIYIYMIKQLLLCENTQFSMFMVWMLTTPKRSEVWQVQNNSEIPIFQDIQGNTRFISPD